MGAIMQHEHTQVGWLDLAAGDRWQTAAWRAAAVFLAGYLVLPGLLGGGNKLAAFLQLLATLLSFGLTAAASYRFLRLRAEYEVLDLEADEDTGAPASAPAPAIARRPVAAAASVAAAPSVQREAPLWSGAQLRGLGQTRLEVVCAAFYREKGIALDAMPQPAWGGVVLRLHQDNSGQPSSLVRCKAADGQQVGRKQIEELLRAMVETHTPKAFFAAPDGFDAEAAKLARAAHITPLDGTLLLAMFNRLHDDARQRLLDLAAPEPAPKAEAIPG